MKHNKLKLAKRSTVNMNPTHIRTDHLMLHRHPIAFSLSLILFSSLAFTWSSHLDAATMNSRVSNPIEGYAPVAAGNIYLFGEFTQTPNALTQTEPDAQAAADTEAYSLLIESDDVPLLPGLLLTDYKLNRDLSRYMGDDALADSVSVTDADLDLDPEVVGFAPDAAEGADAEALANRPEYIWSLNEDLSDPFTADELAKEIYALANPGDYLYVGVKATVLSRTATGNPNESSTRVESKWRVIVPEKPLIDIVDNTQLDGDVLVAKVGESIAIRVTTKENGSIRPNMPFTITINKDGENGTTGAWQVKNRQGVIQAGDPTVVIGGSAFDAETFTYSGVTGDDGTAIVQVTDPSGKGTQTTLRVNGGATLNVRFTTANSPDVDVANFWGHMQDSITLDANGTQLTYARPMLKAESNAGTTTAHLENGEEWATYTLDQANAFCTAANGQLAFNFHLLALNEDSNTTDLELSKAAAAGWPGRSAEGVDYWSVNTVDSIAGTQSSVNWRAVPSSTQISNKAQQLYAICADTVLPTAVGIFNVADNMTAGANKPDYSRIPYPTGTNPTYANNVYFVQEVQYTPKAWIDSNQNGVWDSGEQELTVNSARWSVYGQNNDAMEIGLAEPLNLTLSPDKRAPLPSVVNGINLQVPTNPAPALGDSFGKVGGAISPPGFQGLKVVVDADY